MELRAVHYCNIKYHCKLIGNHISIFGGFYIFNFLIAHNNRNNTVY